MPRRRSGRKIDFTHWTYNSYVDNALSAGTDAQAPTTFISVGIGLILVPEGTGTTVLWSPITDGDAPWMWVTYFELAYEEYVTDVIDSPGMTSYREVIDSKSMRVIRNQEVQCVVENATLATAGSVNISLSGRALSGT